eukprot:scaffold2367_cov58-Phaeocystis_antarctica.AAC.4
MMLMAVFAAACKYVFAKASCRPCLLPPCLLPASLPAEAFVYSPCALPPARPPRAKATVQEYRDELGSLAFLFWVEVFILLILLPWAALNGELATLVRYAQVAAAVRVLGARRRTLLRRAADPAQRLRHLALDRQPRHARRGRRALHTHLWHANHGLLARRLHDHPHVVGSVHLPQAEWDARAQGAEQGPAAHLGRPRRRPAARRGAGADGPAQPRPSDVQLVRGEQPGQRASEVSNAAGLALQIYRASL